VVTGTAGVWIAIVDTGVDYTHPDLVSSRLWLGWDFVNSDNNPMDDHGHGTHVAGIAGANTNNGQGVAGVCWGCGLLAVKVLGADGSGLTSWVADGIQYAAYWGAAFGKRTVINLSLGSPYPSSVLADAVAYAQGQGALIVAAAGNNGLDQLFYPAAYPGVIGVAATDSSDQRASFSNSGSHVDIAAPGVSILSTKWSWYYYKSGTSMATPHVAGVAGLVWSARPALTASQVCGALLRTAMDLGTSGRDDIYGYGRLNAEAAVRGVVPPPPGPPPGPYRVYLPLVMSPPFVCP
jgi:subtilisin family serine protease